MCSVQMHGGGKVDDGGEVKKHSIIAGTTNIVVNGIANVTPKTDLIRLYAMRRILRFSHLRQCCQAYMHRDFGSNDGNTTNGIHCAIIITHFNVCVCAKREIDGGCGYWVMGIGVPTLNTEEPSESVSDFSGKTNFGRQTKFIRKFGII